MFDSINMSEAIAVVLVISLDDDRHDRSMRYFLATQHWCGSGRRLGARRGDDIKEGFVKFPHLEITVVMTVAFLQQQDI